MKIAVISISVNITGAGYADIVHMHDLRNATLQLEVSEDKDAVIFLSEFTEALNFSPRVGKRSNISVIICVLGICSVGYVHSSYLTVPLRGDYWCCVTKENSDIQRVSFAKSGVPTQVWLIPKLTDPLIFLL